MIALKAIQTSLTPTKHAVVYTRRPATITTTSKSSILCLSRSNDSDSEASPPEGDTHKQELLVRIAMLQAQKVRLTDYLDERSAYLTRFGEEANAEFDKIGEDALRGLDEAGDRIMENIESRMQAFEESMELNKEEIEKNDKKLAEYEAQIEEEKNDGLFFRSLGQTKPVQKTNAKEEAAKIKRVTKDNAASRTRRYIYLALIGLVVVAVADTFISSSPDWRKVAVLGAVLVGLLTQFSYEQSMSSETEINGKGNSEENEN
ncbi:hypothetical protein CFOL_v3_12032 [Cephalotus follicularis]|uniref:8-amino-7-oxononanoate synthase n=1 Tax=Cephalotus follicularis TaxID=3775 RepID=A0A1Q3BKV2_CEPFO|nr:hypothetical protein CFOL_v3_12032 [Cephalotus follicularis]